MLESVLRKLGSVLVASAMVGMLSVTVFKAAPPLPPTLEERIAAFNKEHADFTREYDDFMFCVTQSILPSSNSNFTYTMGEAEDNSDTVSKLSIEKLTEHIKSGKTDEIWNLYKFSADKSAPVPQKKLLRLIIHYGVMRNLNIDKYDEMAQAQIRKAISMSYIFENLLKEKAELMQLVDAGQLNYDKETKVFSRNPQAQEPPVSTCKFLI